MGHKRREIAEYIDEKYECRAMWQSEIAKELGITQEQVSLITSKLGYFRGRKQSSVSDFSFLNGSEFDFLDTVKLP